MIARLKRPFYSDCRKAFPSANFISAQPDKKVSRADLGSSLLVEYECRYIALGVPAVLNPPSQFLILVMGAGILPPLFRKFLAE
jgi:hypothetical protein